MKCNVIIPYHKRKNILVNTIHSLDRQSFPKDDFEVVIIGDGTNDFSQEEISSLNLSINIRYINSESYINTCAAFKRNRGIEHSTGEILIFLDCDMVVKPSFIEEHFRFHRGFQPQDSIIQIGLRNFLFDREYPDLIKSLDQLKEGSDFHREERFFMMRFTSQNLTTMNGPWYYVFSNNISVPKATVEQFGSFDENFKYWGGEDNELGYRYYKNGVKIVFNPNIESFHQYHSSELNPDSREGWLKNLNYFMNKHNELPVQLLRILPEVLQKHQGTSREEYEAICHEIIGKLEGSLEVIYDYAKKICRGKLVLTEPSLTDLELKLKADHDTQYTVVCSRNNRELVTWIQANELGRRVLLFTI
jgi:GT2 family glycosyltransferase